MDRDAFALAGKPYNVSQLQGEFHVISPREAYVEVCHRFQCRPITAVADMFSNRVGHWNETTSLDFSLSYVGPKGIRPVVELCKRLPALKSLNCANNYLCNDSIYYLARMAMFHPSLEFIELSGNEHISWTGGTYLAELVVRNSNVKEVGLRGTAVPPHVAEAVFEQTRKNCVLACQQIGRIPHPSSHPTVIHLRAMKRYFFELQQGGTVPASALAEGFRERLRILGQERDLNSYPEVFFEKLCRRAPTEQIQWEVFLIILLLDGVYDKDLVKRFRRVFLEFNVEPATDIEGFVEVRDLVAIHTRLYENPPSPEEITSMYKTLGLDDTMTLHWDEFLLLMYSRGPKEKCLAVGWNHTPLHHPRAILHY